MATLPWYTLLYYLETVAKKLENNQFKKGYYKYPTTVDKKFKSKIAHSNLKIRTKSIH